MKISGNIKYLHICYITAFLGGFCVMAIEIIAGRLIARYLGVSLYTWTSVIGVVLAGIAFGNYIGGRIADRFSSQKTLSLLFILASISCVFIPVVNNHMGNLSLFSGLSWPMRITIHVAMIFLVPATLLGMISPVVAKFALDQGAKPGMTIGNIYAWGTAGSIVGTFVTGFFLIAHIGTIAVVWIIAGFLAIIGLFYGIKNLLSYVWLAGLLFLAFTVYAPLGWANTIAANLFLTEIRQEDVIYEKDSQYSYISIVKSKGYPHVYNFKIDGLTQTSMDINQPTTLDYALPYYRTFADIIKQFGPDKKDMAILFLGGGGYLLPRYLEKEWPTSRIDTVEVDPEITKAAIHAFGLSGDTSIRIHHMDARNYIEDLTRKKNSGETMPLYDFIFCDVVSGGLAVPFHLTTYEFNKKIARLLAPQGLYIINLIDTNISNRRPFLAAAVNTMEKAFPYTYALWPSKGSSFEEDGIIEHQTYVLIGSREELDKTRFELPGFNSRLLSAAELTSLKNISKGMVLTDDYAPVNNLLLDAFHIQGKNIASHILLRKGNKLLGENRIEEAMELFKEIIRIKPDFMEAYNNIGSAMAWQERHDEAIEYYKKALAISPGFWPAILGFGGALQKSGRIDEAIEAYRNVIKLNPEYSHTYLLLGNALLEKNHIDEAIKNYEIVLEMDPGSKEAIRMLVLAEQRKNYLFLKGN